MSLEKERVEGEQYVTKLLQNMLEEIHPICETHIRAGRNGDSVSEFRADQAMRRLGIKDKPEWKIGTCLC